MTTHNQFPLLPGSRKCSSMLSAGRKPQKQMKEGWGGWGGGRGVFFCAAATTGVSGLDKKVDMGRQGGELGSSEGRNTWDKRAGFGSTQGRGGMARGEKSCLERELSWAEGRRVEHGRASYLDRVLSAKCFCWLSACL